MFESKVSPMSVQADLKCACCGERFTDSVKFIPDCGELICGRCHWDLKTESDGRFECPACGQSHMMPTSGLSDCKGIVKSLRERPEKPLSESARSLKWLVESVRAQMSELRSVSVTDCIDRHCDQLELEIGEEIDSAVRHLNAIKAELLKEVHDYNSSCKQAAARRASLEGVGQKSEHAQELEALTGETDFFCSKWLDYFGRLDAVASEKDVKTALSVAKDFSSRIHSLEMRMTKEALNGGSLVFQASHPFFRSAEHWREFIHLSRLEDLDTSRPLKTLTGHKDVVCQAIFLPKGRLASCSKDKSIKVWSVESGKKLFELSGHSTTVLALALLPNGWLASASADKTIKLWDLNARMKIKTLKGHTQMIVSLRVLENGNLVSYSTDDTIRVWNPLAERDHLLFTLKGHENESFTPLACLPSEILVTGSHDINAPKECVLRLWDAKIGKLVKSVVTEFTNPRRILAVSDDELVLAFMDGSIHVIGLEKGETVRSKEKAHSVSVTALALSAGGSLISGGIDSDYFANANSIKLWSWPELSLVRKIVTGHSDLIHSLAVSVDGVVASSSRDGTIKLWPIEQQAFKTAFDLSASQ